MLRFRGILVRRLEEKLSNSLEGSFLVLEIQFFLQVIAKGVLQMLRKELNQLVV